MRYGLGLVATSIGGGPGTGEGISTGLIDANGLGADGLQTFFTVIVYGRDVPCPGIVAGYGFIFGLR